MRNDFYDKVLRIRLAILGNLDYFLRLLFNWELDKVGNLIKPYYIRNRLLEMRTRTEQEEMLDFDEDVYLRAGRETQTEVKTL